MRVRRPCAAVAVTAAALLLSGCTDDAALDTARTTAGGLSASLLRTEAEDAFARKGHPIGGRLECSADPEAEEVLHVDCSGVTRGEEQAEFTGRVDYASVAEREPGDHGLPGHFVGRVAGDEVYVMNCFSCPPSSASEEEEQEGADSEEAQDVEAEPAD